MPIDLFAIIIALLLVAMPSWVLGWYYGMTQYRKRQIRLIKLLEQQNEKERRSVTTGSGDFYNGQLHGIASTLSALERWMEQFKE